MPNPKVPVTSGPVVPVSALELDALGELLEVEAERILRVDRSIVSFACTMQLDERLGAAVICSGIVGALSPSKRRLLVHNLVANLEPGGRLVVDDVVDIGVDARACGLECANEVLGAPAWQRVTRRTVHDLVAEARTRIERLSVDALANALELDAVVVLDTRTSTDRERDGIIPRSLHAPRTVIEWLVDPASGYSLPQIDSFATRIVVVCNEGHSSSLAAATLSDLGFTQASDLVGGVAAWRAAGLPLVQPTHHHDEENP